MAEAGAEARFEVIVVVNGKPSTVTMDSVGTIRDACLALGLNNGPAKPSIGSRPVDWLTHLVPGAVVTLVV